MADLISKSAAINTTFNMCCRWDGEDRDDLRNMMLTAFQELPTIDAVPVVRCKDCKHRDTRDGLCEGRGWPMQLVHDDGFCDKGERRTNG